jgi:hypothetical protein
MGSEMVDASALEFLSSNRRMSESARGNPKNRAVSDFRAANTKRRTIKRNRCTLHRDKNALEWAARERARRLKARRMRRSSARASERSTMCGLLRLISAEFSRLVTTLAPLHVQPATCRCIVRQRICKRAGRSAGRPPVRRMRLVGSNKHDDLGIEGLKKGCAAIRGIGKYPKVQAMLPRDSSGACSALYPTRGETKMGDDACATPGRRSRKCPVVNHD